MSDHSILKDKVAVVTGAGSGIGQAVSLGLAREGVRVVLVGRSIDKLEATAEQIANQGGASFLIQADVHDVDSVNQLATAVLKDIGSPSLIINAAGVHGESSSIKNSDPQKWMETMMVNSVGPYFVCRAFMSPMMKQGWGRIINVTSAASLSKPSGINSSYATSKVALNHFTRQLAAELEGTGITANVVHPGEVKTQMWANIKDGAQQAGIESMTKWADKVEQTGGDSPDKTVELILDIVKPESYNVNGKFLWIKDGMKKPLPSWD